MNDDTEPDRPPPGHGPLWLWLLGGAVALGALLWWLADSFPGVTGGDGMPAGLTYNLIWLVALGAVLMVRIRARPGTVLKQAAIWVLIV